MSDQGSLAANGEQFAKTMDGGFRKVNFAPDALCNRCGHRFDVHHVGLNCDNCDECERGDGVFEPAAWHYFEPIPGPFAGSAEAERAAYERAMKAAREGDR